MDTPRRLLPRSRALPLGFATLILVFIGASGHVQLAYPPPTLKLDFLDNARTRGICGHTASGSDLSQFWRLPEPELDTVTTLQTGENVTVSWSLHYAHQGGFRFELYDSDFNIVSVWNNSDHWGCSHDGTQQSVTLELPKKKCEGCVLRLQRQALEWGAGYLFHSCALVDIVKDSDLDPGCNNCSGHGTCKKGKCVCDSSEKKGFFYGQYCENQNECEEDAHCGEFGKCIDTKALTAPAKQCYCETGYFGEEVLLGKPGTLPTRKCTTESKLEMGEPEEWGEEYDKSLNAGDTMTVYYKVDEEAEEIEFAVRAKTTDWAAIGIRAASVKGQETKKTEAKDGGDGEPANAEGEPVDEAEPTGGNRRLKARMPDLEAEAREPALRSLLQTEKQKDEAKDAAADGESVEDANAEKKGDYEGAKDKKTDAEGEPVEAAGEPNAEGEPAAAEGEAAPAGGICEAGDPVTIEFDEGIHLKEPIPTTLTLGGGTGGAVSEGEGEPAGNAEGEPADGEPAATDEKADKETKEEGNRRRALLSRMPNLEVELAETSYRRMGRALFQDKEEKKTPDAEPAAGEPAAEPTNEADSGSEAEPADAEAEPGEGKKDDYDDFTYFGEGSCKNRLVDNTAAHAMINQDVVVWYAKKNAFRIQDTFTPSRARPIPDFFYGGTDDIVDANGFEADGYTNIKFRKKMQSKDQPGDYCILEDVNYLMIYAIGQSSAPSHTPNSSLETGRFSNKKFYREDELKYHGGGIGTTFPGRGSFGLVNFFEEAQEEGKCAPSSLEDFDCQSAAIGGAITLHWKTDDDGVAFAAVHSGTGWVAVGFPETPGQMIGADAVLGWAEGEEGNVGVYKLEAKTSAGIVADNDAFEISDAAVEETSDQTILTFRRDFDDSFSAASPVDLIVAFHESTKEGFSYHGTNRAPMQVDLAAVPSDDAIPLEPCTASDLDDFDCAVEQLDGKMKVNWKTEEDGVMFALETDAAGYVAIAWPETPGQMIGSDAVIATRGDDGPDISVYKLTAKSTAGIVPSDAFEITDAAIDERDGKTFVTFKRVFDTSNSRRKLLFDGQGATDLLFAIHDSENSLEYHSARDSAPVNFQQPLPLANDAKEALPTLARTEISTEDLESDGCTPSSLPDYSCMQASGAFSLHWELEEDSVRLAAEAETTGYVGLGFTETPNEMIGSMSVIGWTDGSTQNGQVYMLDSKDVAGITVAANALTGVEDIVVTETGTKTTVSFTRTFSEDFEKDVSHNMVFAYGSMDALGYHGPANRASLDINFFRGKSAASSGEDLTKYWDLHAWLMVIGWGALLPIGVIIARTMKDQDPLWFRIHMGCQILGLVIAIVGWIVALVKFNPPDNFRHGNIGMAVMIISFFQPLNGFLRPKHGMRFREQWEWVHWTVGRVCIVLALWNIFLGLNRYDELNAVGQKYHVNFGLWLMSLFIVYLTMEARSQGIKGEKSRREFDRRLKEVEAANGLTGVSKASQLSQPSYANANSRTPLRR